jgi:hypothetical protein
MKSKAYGPSADAAKPNSANLCSVAEETPPDNRAGTHDCNLPPDKMPSHRCEALTE